MSTCPTAPTAPAPSGSTWRGATGTTRMLAATRLTRAAMPGLVEGSEPAGMLRTEVAEAWGVRRVPSRGRGRRPGRLSGAGVIDGSRASLSLGTSGVLFVADAAYRTNPERAVHSFPAARRPAGRGHRAGAVRELRAAAPVGEWFRTASVVRQSHRRAVGRDQDLAVASLAPDVVPVRIGSDRNVLRSRRPPERAGGQDVGLLALNMNDSPARIDPGIDHAPACSRRHGRHGRTVTRSAGGLEAARSANHVRPSMTRSKWRS